MIGCQDTENALCQHIQAYPNGIVSIVCTILALVFLRLLPIGAVIYLAYFLVSKFCCPGAEVAADAIVASEDDVGPTDDALDDSYQRALEQTQSTQASQASPFSDARHAVSKAKSAAKYIQQPKAKAKAAVSSGRAPPGQHGKAPSLPQMNTVEGNYGAIQDVATPVG